MKEKSKPKKEKKAPTKDKGRRKKTFTDETPKKKKK